MREFRKPDGGELSGEINDDDGVDPRRYLAPPRRSRSDHRKASQLCRQVTDTLHYVLHGDGSDDLLSSLTVVQVLPAPDTSRLLVVVVSDLPVELFQPDQVVSVLETQTGRLRTEIARTINRKKTPQLIYQVVVRA